MENNSPIVLEDFQQPWVQLVAYTSPVADMTAEDFIVWTARISNPANQDNLQTSKKLLRYLVEHKHWSPLEMVDITLTINTTRDIARQILRHRFSFQEFCVAGDTLITLEPPRSRVTQGVVSYKKSIEELYNLQKTQDVVRYARVFDENSRTFIKAPIKEVFDTGIKPLFKVTLSNGKSITTTKEHKFLTSDGFCTLEDAVGLVNRGNTWGFTKTQVSFATNGVAAHKDFEWLKSAKERAIANKSGIPGMAVEAGVSYHTIRKWLRIHKLTFSKKETASMYPIWNKGVYGYKNPKLSMETIEKMRKSARKGAQSNLWRGGVNRQERQRIGDWQNALRKEFLHRANYCCARCGSHDKLELHHIIPVFERLDLAYDKDNIEVLCKSCHQNTHSIAGHRKLWRERTKGNTLTVEWAMVTSVEYVGEMQTYDLEVDHTSHNYVANGIVTHNSQRYANPLQLGFLESEARLQDVKNRQSSIEVVDPELEEAWLQKQHELLSLVTEHYEWAIEHGLAKEVARKLLPEGLTMSRMYVKGSVRNWIHYCQLRMGNGTQKEHQQIAKMCWEEIRKVVPTVVEMIEELEEREGTCECKTSKH